MRAEDFFYQEIGKDLSKIVWGHAVNGKDLLTQALHSDSPVMMLEADVSRGYLSGDGSRDLEPIPVMAHPPFQSSDISLEMWISEVIQANQKGLKKGVKLDFKNTDIIHQSLEILKKYSSSMQFPLWLNADIIEGPGEGNSMAIDPDIFLISCSKFFPKATLSVGWTTKLVMKENQYTYKMIEDMSDALKNNGVNQPLTFAIRAAFVGNSMDTLFSLAQKYPDDSFTIWASVYDDVDSGSIVSFLNVIGDDRVYLDLQEKDKNKIREMRRK